MAGGATKSTQDPSVYELAIKELFAFFKGRLMISIIFFFFTVVVCYQIYANNTSLDYVISQVKRLLDVEPQLNASTYPKIAEELSARGVASVSILSVDVGAATRRLEYSQINNVVQKKYVGDYDFLYMRLSPGESAAAMMDKARYNDAIIALQSGEFVCGTHVPATRYGLLMSDKGVITLCAIGIPSGLSAYFVGIIAVGFDRVLTQGEKDMLRSDLFRYSQRIISR